MYQNVLDRLDLFVSIDCESGVHDVPEMLFPAPTYFVRTAEKSIKTVLRLQAEPDSEHQNDNHLRLVTNLKAAMGRELIRECERSQWTTAMSQQVSDEWDQILDSEAMY